MNIPRLLDPPASPVRSTVSLGKAQKWHERLVAAIASPAEDADADIYAYRRRRRYRGGADASAKSFSPAVIVVPVTAAARGESLVSAARERAAQARLAMLESRDLAADAARLKEAIFAANQSSGASRLMAEIRLWTDRLSVAEKALAALEKASDPVSLASLDEDAKDLASRLEKASATALSGGTASVSLTVSWQSADEIRAERSAARSALNALDDDLRAINANASVEVILSASGAAALGL